MANKPKPPRKLPLESPHWLSFVDIHRLFVARVGSPGLAARDMTSALRSGKLRSMRRRAHPSPKFPERELQTPEFWTNREVSSWSDGLLIVPVRQQPNGRQQVIPLKGFFFFGWEPDLKKMELATEAKAKPKAKPKTRKRPALKRGKRRQFDRDVLKQLIEQHPKWENKQLEREFKRLTGTEPSRQWFEKYAPAFRRAN